MFFKQKAGSYIIDSGRCINSQVWNSASIADIR